VGYFLNRWSLLKRNQKDRICILSSHHIIDADALAGKKMWQMHGTKAFPFNLHPFLFFYQTQLSFFRKEKLSAMDLQILSSKNTVEGIT